MLGNETIADNHYRYDGNGNRLEKCQRQNGGTALVTSYAYDSRNRLSVVEYPDRKEELFYDRAGNRTRRLTTGRDGIPQREELYRYDKRNRLTTCSDNGRITGFSYDGAGNLLSDDKATYEYDAFGRNTRAETFNGHIQISRYDPEGLRHEMEENGRLVTFIFRGEEIITEATAEGMIRYIRTHELLASDAESARTYYHYASDEMGSITHVTAGEEILNRYEYDVWGVPEVCKEQTENRFLFNGQQYDPVTGQYYLRARFYNPVIGRFTQEDTYRGDGLNLYTYCQNNPVYYVDPSGHICEKRANEIMNKLGRGDVLSHSENKKLAIYLRNKERHGGLTDAESSVLSQVDRKRRGDSGSGNKTKTLFRGDKASAVPNEVFQNGFKPKGTHNDALLHTKSNTTAGNFVSTSSDKAIATDFAGKNGYVYVIQTNNYVDINSTYGSRAYYPEQMEFSIPDGIKPFEIVGAYKKQGGEIAGTFIPNPNFGGN